MSDIFYIIIVDIDGFESESEYRRFHRKITNAKAIKSWWHYLNSTYIIKVEKKITVDNVARFVQSTSRNKKFFVTEIDLKNSSGWLPKRAWDWIKKNSN